MARAATARSATANSTIVNGAIIKSGGAGLSVISASVSNGATVEVETGALELTGASNVLGHIEVEVGALELAGKSNVLDEATVSGAGKIDFTGGGTTSILV